MFYYLFFGVFLKFILYGIVFKYEEFSICKLKVVSEVMLFCIKSL